jgi:hypothetical protein
VAGQQRRLLLLQPQRLKIKRPQKEDAVLPLSPRKKLLLKHPNDAAVLLPRSRHHQLKSPPLSPSLESVAVQPPQKMLLSRSQPLRDVVV